MKLTFTKLGSLLVASLLNSATYGVEIDEHRLLAAIAEVETGTRNLDRACRKIGKHGERSAWQFRAGTWRQYTRAPFEVASTCSYSANLVAAAHVRLLRTHIQYRYQTCTPFLIAAAWNAGLNRVLEDRIPPAAKSYGERVVNIYHALGVK